MSNASRPVASPPAPVPVPPPQTTVATLLAQSLFLPASLGKTGFASALEQAKKTRPPTGRDPARTPTREAKNMLREEPPPNAVPVAGHRLPSPMENAPPVPVVGGTPHLEHVLSWIRVVRSGSSIEEIRLRLRSHAGAVVGLRMDGGAVTATLIEGSDAAGVQTLTQALSERMNLVVSER